MKELSFIQIVEDDLEENLAFSLEIKLIEFYGRIDLGSGCLRNKTNGGDGLSGMIRTKKHRKLLSNIMKEKWADPDFKYKRCLSLKGKTGAKWTEERKRKFSLLTKGRKKPRINRY